MCESRINAPPLPLWVNWGKGMTLTKPMPAHLCQPSIRAPCTAYGPSVRRKRRFRPSVYLRSLHEETTAWTTVLYRTCVGSVSLGAGRKCVRHGASRMRPSRDFTGASVNEEASTMAASTLSVAELKSRLQAVGITDLNDVTKEELVALADSLDASSSEKAQPEPDLQGVQSEDPDAELQYTIALSAVTCCIPAISLFFSSDEWRLAVTAFFERYCAAETHDVYLAFRKLIDKLIGEQLLQLQHAPDVRTLAMFCERVGTSDELDGWVEADVAEQAKLMLLCDDEERFAELMREYASMTSNEAGGDTLADLEDAFGFSALFPGPPPLQSSAAHASAAPLMHASKGSAELADGASLLLTPAGGFGFASFTQVQHGEYAEREERSAPLKPEAGRPEVSVAARRTSSKVLDQEEESNASMVASAQPLERVTFVTALAQARSIVPRRAAPVLDSGAGVRAKLPGMP